MTGKQPERYEALAREKSSLWRLPFVPREGALRFDTIDAYLVLGVDGWSLRDAQGTLSFTPGLAAVRIKRLGTPHQEDDVLVRLCELKPGDSVFDGTFGLGADALVCATIVGAQGRVIAAEASFALWALAFEGLARGGEPLLEGAAKIELRHGPALDALRAMADRSVDCVIFDPMFDRPKKATPAFELLRRVAVHAPLDEATLAQARRVARRWVVVKGGRYGKELRRLGLEEIRLSRYSPTVWARVEGQR